MLLLQNYRQLIEQKAKENQLDPILIGSIIMKESSGIPSAYRFEPAFYKKYLKGKDNRPPEVCSASYGLMQIMLTTAESLGFSGGYKDLYIPSVNLTYGCRFLKKLFIRYIEREPVIAAYNAGSPRKLPNGKWVNQDYVDKVNRFYRDIKRDWA